MFSNPIRKRFTGVFAASCVSALALIAAQPASAAVIIDEDFEVDGGGFSSFAAYDYAANSDTGNPTGGTTAFDVDGSTFNYTDIETIGDYTIAWDFVTLGSTSSRSMNMTLRSGAGNANLMNVAVAADGDDTLNIYNGSWQPIGDGGELADDNWYRITISGTMQPTGTYSVTVIDLEDGNNVVISETGLAYYQTTPGVDEGSAYLDLRNNADYAVDNFYFESNVPEPASLALLGLGGLAIVARRRRA